MKNNVGSRKHAALCLQHEVFGIPYGKEIFANSIPEQTEPHLLKKINMFGLSEDSGFKQLTEENQNLKSLVGDLMLDKLSQAQRIMELNEEKSRLKRALADLVLGNQH